VAARLAGLLRARTGGAQLVPVHDPGPRPSAGPPATRSERRALPIAGRPAGEQAGPDEDELPAAPG
jgi:hypothetical protein